MRVWKGALNGKLLDEDEDPGGEITGRKVWMCVTISVKLKI